MEQDKILDGFRREAHAAKDLTDLMNTLFDAINEGMDPDAISYLSYDADTAELCFVHTETTHMDRLKGTGFPSDLSIMGWVATNRESVMTNDPYSDPRFSDAAYKLAGIRANALISIPLQVGERLLGVVELISKFGAHDFADDDLQKAETIVRATADELEAQGDQERDELLTDMKNRLHKSVRPEGIAILLHDEAAQTLTFLLAEAAVMDSFKDIRVDVNRGLVGWVAREQETLLVADAPSDGRFAKWADKVTHFQTGSVACAPVLDGTELLGVIQVLNRQGGAIFTEEDVGLVAELSGELVAPLRKLS